MLKQSSYVRLAPRLYTQRQPLHRLHDNTTGLPNRPTDEVTNFGSCGYNQRTTQVLTLPRCRETTQSAVFALRLHSQAIRSQPRPVQLPSTAPPFMLFLLMSDLKTSYPSYFRWEVPRSERVLVPLELDISSERRYKNVVLSSGFVNRSAICSLVGIQLMLMMRLR